MRHILLHSVQDKKKNHKGQNRKRSLNPKQNDIFFSSVLFCRPRFNDCDFRLKVQVMFVPCSTSRSASKIFVWHIISTHWVRNGNGIPSCYIVKAWRFFFISLVIPCACTYSSGRGKNKNIILWCVKNKKKCLVRIST